MLPRYLYSYIIIFSFNLFANQTFSQNANSNIIADWNFHPNYTLKRNAANYPGNKIDSPSPQDRYFKTLKEPIVFSGMHPTDRITDIVDVEKLPQGAFSIEMWILNHVNLPVGALMALRGSSDTPLPAWYLGFSGNEVIFYINTKDGTSETLVSKVKKGWKKYWGHIVGVYDGKEMSLYLNGDLILSSDKLHGDLKLPEYPQFEIAGYFENEPFMEISNLIKSARIHDHALSELDIKERYSELQEKVEKGRLFDEIFHFNAGPYLNYSTKNSINLIWETDRLASAILEYGEKLPFDKSIELKEANYIQEVTLTNLLPQTPYYYKVTAIAENGEKMESGTLTFSTAVHDDSAFSFCIIGDTESRPHVNQKLGELIWEERPNFIMHLGDVTDGGKRPHKFEWNYEYFTGITSVASRIPIFPVPGNGESDLYWYNRYHRLPAPESYYSFKFGNAEFFMLNSNENDELQKGGEQYEWLKNKLNDSKATWKFVSHHHCPYSSDENDFGNTWMGEISGLGDPKFDDLKALYESGGIDVVFYGHVHAYERSWPLKGDKVDQNNGVVYIKSGGGGGHLEDFSSTSPWFSNKRNRSNHFCHVSIFDNTFSFKVFDLDGKLKDFFDLKK